MLHDKKLTLIERFLRRIFAASALGHNFSSNIFQTSFGF